MTTSNFLLRCRRSHTELWKKEDVMRFFELTDDTTESDNFSVKSINDRIKDYTYFIIEPRTRLIPGEDAKLKEHDDMIYFALYGCDDKDPRFVRHVFCGYAIGTTRILNMFK